jgi:hypothetical protein
MAETRTTDNKEAFNAFVSKYNLDPSNNHAIMNCLFELSEKMNEVGMFIPIDKITED